jgi:preprotein translocase subunit YajC
MVAAEPLATEANAVVAQPASPPRQAPVGGWLNIGLLVIMAVFIYLMIREPRKKQQQHKKMIESLQKNDKVCTIGGIIGTVVEVKGDEVVLKVDDSNNTKIHVRTTAIASNLSASKKNS